MTIIGPHANNKIVSLDLLNAAFVQSGLKASRPTSSSSNTGMVYLCTDTYELLTSNGTGTGGDLTDGWDYAVWKDAAAGVGSLRTLGTAATQAAAGDHAHSISQSQAVNDPETIGAVGRDICTERALNTLPTTLCTKSITVGGSGKHALVYSGAMLIYNTNCTHSPTFTLTVKRDGVSKGTSSSAALGVGASEIIILQAFEQNVAAGTYSITLELSSSVSDGDSCDEAGGALAVSEVTV